MAPLRNALAFLGKALMSEEAPEQKQDAFDVVLMHGPTEDGEGARVLRARPGRLDAGEVRPVREGKPLGGGGEIVRLEQRADAPAHRLRATQSRGRQCVR